MEDAAARDIVKDYYEKGLQGTQDLNTNACCSSDLRADCRRKGPGYPIAREHIPYEVR